MAEKTSILNKLARNLDKVSIRHFHKKIENFNELTPYLTGKDGLEIGGPSEIFAEDGYIPVYPLASVVDGCNVPTNWDSREEGPNFRYEGTLLGYQHVTEATDLSNILPDVYDFILSSHTLEHIANPVKALAEWVRVLKPGGLIILVVPDKQFTFDRRRPFTTFEHLMSDFDNNVGEDDLSHLEEILLLHDLAMDAPAGNAQNFRDRSLENLHNRYLHHHVFSFELIEQLFSHLQLELIRKTSAWPFHMIAAGRKKVK